MIVPAALAAAAAIALPSWAPAHVELGLASQPGGAQHVRAEHATWRYQYLAGGVNTGSGWSTWNPDGTFASRYVAESRQAGVTPVLTYYQLLPSRGAGDGKGEAERDLANLDDADTMKAYYNDFALALRRVHDEDKGRRAVVHVEPDLWGYVEQRAGASNDPASVPAAVASSGDPRLGGLPDTAAGFAQALVRLRDVIAPEVKLGYHMSTWGTGTDPVQQNPSLKAVDGLAGHSGTFYNNLHARFDLVFSDPSDRDDGFDLKVNHDHGHSRWTAGDYARDERWLRGMHAVTRLPLVMWQIPLGNSHLPNTKSRYRDTHVQRLLGPDPRTRRAYRDAGVIAFLFGGGADGTTSEKTDGGVFQRLAARYARARLSTKPSR
ncbi:hypothetical protein [Conexibacter woesei]|uniref:hypothetical protein n=1 Tax=Conexibacter woesei TaxID=191495 RepID=UPI0003FCE9CA|nr:hypothetical protein [Conexibacter woesei]